MNLQEQAKIIALAKMCGITGSNEEILDKYSEYYQAALESLTPECNQATVEVFKHPF